MLETAETRARQASVFMVPRLSGLMDNDETVVLLAFYRVSGFEYGLSMTILGILSKSRLYVLFNNVKKCTACVKTKDLPTCHWN